MPISTETDQDDPNRRDMFGIRLRRGDRIAIGGVDYQLRTKSAFGYILQRVNAEDVTECFTYQELEECLSTLHGRVVDQHVHFSKRSEQYPKALANKEVR
ncbi:hypothetical protein HFO02_34105 [Rhizobium laguerreae]|uniref:hypothetical protein n=1 Tax=Rhizobium laguerreae TaxID=1076926 RepID=UPI001C92A0BE|nr:hypothetical protein [Rhizobium laguerreae]MBY3328535.1 hypothetical protein [Rhizobium laguerreae]